MKYQYIYYYKKKLVGPFEEPINKKQEQFIKDFINSGMLDNMENQNIFPDADPEEFIMITNNKNY